MTSEELDAIEARAKAATPGPWRVGSEEQWHVFGDPDGDHIMGRGYGIGRVLLGMNIHFPYDADAAFIAAARSDVPALVAALREAWRERDAAFAVGQREGAEAMREWAAGNCPAHESVCVVRGFGDAHWTACADLIRALPIPTPSASGSPTPNEDAE